MKLNGSRPGTFRAPVVREKKADVWQTLDVAEERATVHSLTDIVQDLSERIGLTVSYKLRFGNHVMLSIASLAEDL